MAIGRNLKSVMKTGQLPFQCNSRTVQVIGIYLVKPGHVTVAGLLDDRPLKTGLSKLETVTAGQFQCFLDLGSVPHHFLGHATDVDTGSTQGTRFEKQNPGAVYRRLPSRSDSATSTSNHDKIKRF